MQLNQRNIRIYIGVCILVLLLLIGLFIYITTHHNSKVNEFGQGSSHNLTDVLPSTGVKNIKTPSYSSSVKDLSLFPPVNFKTYENRASILSLPEKELNSYLLSKNLDIQEIAKIQTVFGFEKTRLSDANTILYGSMSKEILAINRSNGKFLFESIADDEILSGFAKKYGNYNIKEQAFFFLRDIGLNTAFISCPITYSKTDYKGYIFLECHQDWKKIGLPILNPAGLLDIPENVSLSSLTVGMPTMYAEEDKSIYNVSDGNNYKKRPDDFNTATFIFDDKQHLVVAKSNLLFLSNPSKISNTLLTPSLALKQFVSHKSAYSMASIIGEGLVDPEISFPSGIASGMQAVITDFILAYIQNPSLSQIELSPVYLIRGYSNLDSGFRANFLEIIPASKTASISQVFGVVTKNGQVLGDMTGLESEVSDQTTLSLSCLKNTGASPSLATNVGSKKTAIIKGDGFGNGQSVTIIACIKKAGAIMKMGSDCTSGNSLIDKLWGLSTNPGFVFDVGGTNPKITGQDGTITPFSVITSTEQVDVDIYYYGGVPKKQSTSGNSGSLQQAQIIFDSQRKDCAFVSWNACVADKMHPSEEQLIGVKVQADGSKIGRWKYPGDVPLVMYYVPPPSVQMTENRLYQNIFAIQTELSQNASGEVTYIPRTQDRIIQEFREVGLCPIRITGGSPTLFVYGKPDEMMSIKPQFSVVYTDTLRNNDGSWSIMIGENNTFKANLLDREYIYYEYDQKKIQLSSLGWNINKSKVTEFVVSISKKLRLLPKETERLQFEFKYAILGFKDQSDLSIRLISQSEINNKFPFKMVPQPNNLYRYNFLVTYASDTVINEPVLPIIKRNGLTVVELGAVPQF